MSENQLLEKIKADICLLDGTLAGEILGSVVKHTTRDGLIYDVIHSLDERNFRLFLDLLAELRDEKKYGKKSINNPDMVIDELPEYIDKAINLLNIDYHHLQSLFLHEHPPVDVKANCLQHGRFRDRIVSYLKACLVESAILCKTTTAISVGTISCLSFIELIELHEIYQYTLRH